MSRRGTLGLGLLVGVALSAMGPAAWADGPRDLEDGIAFYENLDLERARERLVAASAASDLDRSGRARAQLYLGMLEFELGNPEAADAAWRLAFGLEPKMAAPEGTSPKTISAMDDARRRAKPLPPDPPPRAPPTITQVPPPAPPPPIAAPPPVEVPPPPASPPPALVTTPEPAPDEDEGTSPWLWVGIGAGAVAVAAAVTLALVLGGGADSECPRGGGCLEVTLP